MRSSRSTAAVLAALLLTGVAAHAQTQSDVPNALIFSGDVLEHARHFYKTLCSEGGPFEENLAAIRRMPTAADAETSLPSLLATMNSRDPDLSVEATFAYERTVERLTREWNESVERAEGKAATCALLASHRFSNPRRADVRAAQERAALLVASACSPAASAVSTSH